MLTAADINLPLRLPDIDRRCLTSTAAVAAAAAATASATATNSQSRH